MSPTPPPIELVCGNIVEEQVDAIVNAANASLLGGGGVDGAIHRAAGRALLLACRAFPVERGARCPTGEARTTPGFALPARWVIHTVGPVYTRMAPSDAARLLAAAHRNSLQEAVRIGARSVSFPAISTGVYGYPMGEAAQVALRTTGAFLEAHPGAFDRVRFVLFFERDLRVWRGVQQRLGANS